MTKFTREETLDILTKAMEEREKGNIDESERISKLIPLAPHLAKIASEIVGISSLKEYGFDLSEAEAIYGQNLVN